MAAVLTTPVWSSFTALASQSLAKGSIVSGTVDLTGKLGAYLFIRQGRKGATALTNGVAIMVRKKLATGSLNHPGALWAQQSSFAAPASTTVSADAAAGQKNLTPTSAAGFAAGDYCVLGDGTAREEWLRIAKVAAGIITFDTNLQFAHTAVQADHIANKADIYAPIPLDGGSIIEVIFDYADDAAGSDVQIEAVGQQLDDWSSE